MARTIAMLIIMVLSLVDHILGLIYGFNAIVSLIIRPFVVYIFFSAIRSNMWMILHSLKDTMVILITILVYIFLFAVLSYYLFRNTFEGVIYLSDVNESYYQLLILLTTANFPDVMLPAYETDYFHSLIFVLYLIIGLYFFCNILLANVFSMYKRRLEEILQSRTYARVKRVERFFEKYDDDKNGYLDVKECRNFFAHVFELKYKKKEHQRLFIEILSNIASMHP